MKRLTIYKEVEVEIDLEDEFGNLSTSDQIKIIKKCWKLGRLF